MEKVLTKPEIISALTKSTHGKLCEYAPVGLAAVREDEDFFAHLVAWNHVKGQIRDAKIALPVLALAGAREEYRDNAVAHLADLRPREFVRALEFSREVKIPVKLATKLATRYLRDLEADTREFDRTTLLHAKTLKDLYRYYHIKPSPQAQEIVFEGKGGKRALLKTLKHLGAEQIAGVMQKHRLPFLTVRGALEERAKEPDVLTALIGAMTSTELVTNMKALERLGVKDVAAARAALEAALTNASQSSKVTLKTSRAAEAMGDEQIARKLHSLQERQLNSLKGIEGDWLVLGDKSGSMHVGIEKSREVASVLARLVRGKVYLTFFDTSPRSYEVSGKTLEEITALTKGITAGGGTSIGCGVQALADRKIHVDGIAIVTDEGECNSPTFAQAYEKYVRVMGVEPTIYVYHVGQNVGGYAPFRTTIAHLDPQYFDCANVDYYSLPNLVQTMRVGRYSLLDEVLGAELKTLDQVLDRTTGMKVLSGRVLVGA